VELIQDQDKYIHAREIEDTIENLEKRIAKVATSQGYDHRSLERSGFKAALRLVLYSMDATRGQLKSVNSLFAEGE